MNLLQLASYLPVALKLMQNWVLNLRWFDLIVEFEGYVEIPNDGTGAKRRFYAIKRIRDDIGLIDLPGDFDEMVLGRLIDTTIRLLNHYFGHNWAEKLRPLAELQADEKASAVHE